MECFTHKQKRQTKSSSVVGAVTPMSAGPSQQMTQGHQPIHVYLVPQNAGPCLLLQEKDTVTELARCHMIYTLRQNKGMYTKYTPKQEKIFPDKPSTSQESPLSPGKKVFPAQSSFLYGQPEVERLSARDEIVS